jgi:hypothetical protein
MTWRRERLGVATVVALLAACVGCASGNDRARDERPNGLDVRPESATEAESEGARVLVPEGAVDREGRLLVDWRAADLGEPSGGLHFIDRGVEVSLDGAKLVAPAKVTFPVPDGIDRSREYPVIVWQVADGKWQWVSAPTDTEASTISAELTHFSPGFLGRFDIDATARRWARDAVNYITGRSGVAQPACGDEAGARADGTSITSDQGDTVKWCVGLEDGRRLVRVANNRRSYAQVTFPEDWEVIDGGGLGLSLEAASRFVADSAGELTAPQGHQVRLIAGGDTVTLAAPTPGNVRVEMSMIAWLTSAIQLGYEVYAFVARTASAGLQAPTDSSWQRTVGRLAGTESLGPWGDALRDCSNAISSHLADDPLSADALNTDLASNLMRVGWECVPGLMQADIESTGVRFFGIGVLLSLVGAVASAVLTAMHIIITGMREIWDEIASFSGPDDAFYDLRILSNLSLENNSLGPLTIGMSLGDAKATGWLGESLTPCGVLLGISDGQSDQEFTLDGPSTPQGVSGRTLFADGVLTEIWAYTGVYVAGRFALTSDVTQSYAVESLGSQGYMVDVLTLFEPDDYISATEPDGDSLALFFQDGVFAGVPQITTCE